MPMVLVSCVRPPRFRHPYVEQARDAIADLARRRESPSTGAILSTLSVTQEWTRGDAIYNNRPPSLIAPPVQIYNPAFVTFIREMSHPCSTIEFSHKELDKALRFIYASLGFYGDKSDRRAMVHDLHALGNLFPPEINLRSRIIEPDGTATVRCHTTNQEAIVRIVEMKNEIGEGRSDPIMQAECGFVLICSSEEVSRFLISLTCIRLLLLQYEPLRNASCVPMFLVGVAGPHLTVSGAVFAERFVSQRLTDYIYLGPLNPSGGPGSPCTGQSHGRAQRLLLKA